MTKAESYNLVSIDRIYVDKDFNCRGDITPFECEELATSVKKVGLLQPLIVRKREDRGTDDIRAFQLIAGHRRLVAVQSLGWTEVPCLVMCLTTLEAHAINLQENLARQDLTPGQECAAIVAMYGPRPCISQVCEDLGRSKSWVTVRLKIQTLSDAIQKDINRGVFTAYDVGLLTTCRQGEQESLARDLLIGKSQGISSTAVAKKRNQRPNLKCKKEIQEMITRLMDEDLVPPLWRGMAWCAGTITDDELLYNTDKKDK